MSDRPVGAPSPGVEGGCPSPKRAHCCTRAKGGPRAGAGARLGARFEAWHRPSCMRALSLSPARHAVYASQASSFVFGQQCFHVPSRPTRLSLYVIGYFRFCFCFCWYLFGLTCCVLLFLFGLIGLFSSLFLNGNISCPNPVCVHLGKASAQIQHMSM